MSQPTPLPEPDITLVTRGEDPTRIHSFQCILAYGKAEHERGLEDAAVAAWSHYMDTCYKRNIGPANQDWWCATKAIRELKGKP
jgi:hypothetical protein